MKTPRKVTNDRAPRDRRRERQKALSRAAETLKAKVALGPTVAGVAVQFDEAEVLLITGWGRSTLDREISAGNFPAPVYSTSSRGRRTWLATHLAEWTARLSRPSPAA